MQLIHGIPLPLPVHLTLRSTLRPFFALSTHEAWHVFGETIREWQESQALHVHAALLMSNHAHLLITSFHRQQPDFLRRFGEHVATQLRSKLGLGSAQFGLRTESYEIRHEIYFGRALKYIYRNPVRAGLCRRVEDYPFSTVHQHLGETERLFLLQETYFGRLSVPSDPVVLLDWLNRG